jgi:hypothetical protein
MVGLLTTVANGFFRWRRAGEKLVSLRQSNAAHEVLEARVGA